MGKNQHVTPKGDKWQVIVAGNIKAIAIVNTQRQAQSIVVEIAKSQKSEVLIHRANGQLRSKDSYGSDPFPPKG